MEQVFQDNPHYREYLLLLKRLHEFLARGQGDYDAANVVRDQLDEHLKGLNEHEYHRAEGLCEDLYTLVEDRPPSADARRTPPRSRDEISAELAVAWGHDWDRVLELLREARDSIPLDVVSHARGRCWEALGDLDTASRFFARASELRPPYHEDLSQPFARFLMRVGLPVEAEPIA